MPISLAEQQKYIKKIRLNKEQNILYYQHRIIDDRIEKSKKGRRIGHCVFAASIFKVQRLRQY